MEKLNRNSLNIIIIYGLGAARGFGPRYRCQDKKAREDGG